MQEVYYQFDAGKAEAREEAKRETAAKLMKAGVNVQIIVAATGLPEEELIKL